MKFCDRLNLYIETLGCSAKTLSAVSGISDAAISRYRSGEREPGRDSEQLLRLAQGICAIAAESDYSPGFSEGEVLCTSALPCTPKNPILTAPFKTLKTCSPHSASATQSFPAP